MIYSSDDVVSIIKGDALISSLSVIKIIDGIPSIDLDERVAIYISRYPVVKEFEATWDLWIFDVNNEPVDLIIEQLKNLLPKFEIVSNGSMIHCRTTELLAAKTLTNQTSSNGNQNIKSLMSVLQKQFDSLKESIEDRMLLITSGKPGKDGRPGRDGKDGQDGKDLLATEARLDDLLDVSVPDPKEGQVLTFSGEAWIPKFAPKRLGGGGAGNAVIPADIQKLTYLAETGEPTGHLDKTQSHISFDSASRTFTIEPVDEYFIVWVKSKRFIINQARSVQVPNVSGLYYIFFDEDGELGYQSSFFVWDQQALTAYVYWDAEGATCPYLGDERHGITLDWQTHEYLHRTRGAVLASGFEISNYTILGTGDLDTDAQFDLAGGTFFDEDMEIQITHSDTPDPELFQQDLQGPAKIPAFYRLNQAWKIDDATVFPVKVGASTIYYNQKSGSNWTLTQATNNKYVNYYIAATNNVKAPIVSIMDQKEHQNVADAQDQSFFDLDRSGFPSLEFRVLYKIIYQSGTYDNAIKARVASIQDLRYADNTPGIKTLT